MTAKTSRVSVRFTERDLSLLRYIIGEAWSDGTAMQSNVWDFEGPSVFQSYQRVVDRIEHASIRVKQLNKERLR
jgi:hypothetical protein